MVCFSGSQNPGAGFPVSRSDSSAVMVLDEGDHSRSEKPRVVPAARSAAAQRSSHLPERERVLTASSRQLQSRRQRRVQPWRCWLPPSSRRRCWLRGSRGSATRKRHWLKSVAFPRAPGGPDLSPGTALASKRSTSQDRAAESFPFSVFQGGSAEDAVSRCRDAVRSRIVGVNAAGSDSCLV